MKPVLLFLFLATVVKINAQIDTANCQYEPRHSLDYEHVKKYVQFYNSNHSKNNRIKKLNSRAYYVSSNAFLFLSKFFKAHPQYNGFNIYLMSYNKRRANGQSKRKQPFPYIVPTINILDVDNKLQNVLADYSILKTYYNLLPANSRFGIGSLNNGIACYGECDLTIANWLGISSSVNRLKNPKDWNDLKSGDLFLITDTREDNIDKRRKYNKKFNSNDRQTKWAHMETGTIHRIADFLTSPGGQSYPAVGIYFGSYNNDVPTTISLKDPKQTMFMLTPMRLLNDGFLEPDICAYTKYLRRLSLDMAITSDQPMRLTSDQPMRLTPEEEKKLKSILAENHGSLCPYNCSKGGE